MREFELPEGWISLEIGDISEVIAGGTPNASESSNFAEPGTAIAWITPADLSGYKQQYITHGSRDLSQKGYGASSAKLMPAGTLLFSSRAPIGYVAIAANPISTNQGFKNFVFSPYLSSKYFYHYLKSIRDLAESRGTGTTFKELSGANAKKLPFILVPLAEQHEIAARLDTLLAQVDAAKARLDGIPALLKRFRQSVLAAAVSGKLTEGWRDENVMGEWKQDILSNVASSRLGKMLDKNKNKGKNAPYLRNTNVRWFSFDLSDIQEMQVTDKEIDELKVLHGDILICEGGEPGRCAIWKEKNTSMIYQKALHRVRVSKALIPEWVCFCIKNAADTQMLEQLFTGTTIKHLTGIALSKFILPLPPLEEQAEIVTRVEALFAFADLIEARVKTAQAQVNQLTQAILAKAFRGELTAEWRAQHPELISGENSAEALLARIQAERGQSEKPAKKAGKKAGVARKAKSAAPVEAEGDELPAGQLNLPGLVLPEAVETGG
jgi:type I restriction enzyme, S subunit